MRRLLLPLTAGLALVTVMSACGSDADTPSTDSGSSSGTTGTTGTEVVDVGMEDIRFDQTELRFAAGTTVEFRFTNNGKVAHDAYVGDLAAQQEHEAEMAEMASMGDMGSHGHGEPAVTVQPGGTDSLTYTFDQAGTYEVGCHQPGHYAAGMKMTITVT